MSEHWNGEERRKIPLTEQQLQVLVEKASDLTVQKLQTQLFVSVGKSIVTRSLQLIGAALVALYFWLKSKGLIE